MHYALGLEIHSMRVRVSYIADVLSHSFSSSIHILWPHCLVFFYEKTLGSQLDASFILLLPAPS